MQARARVPRLLTVLFRRMDMFDRLLVCPKEEKRVADKHHQQEDPCELGDDSQEEQHNGENRYQSRDQRLSSHALVDHHRKDERGEAQRRRDDGDIGANDIHHGKGWLTASRSNGCGEHLLWFQSSQEDPEDERTDAKSTCKVACSIEEPISSNDEQHRPNEKQPKSEEEEEHHLCFPCTGRFLFVSRQSTSPVLSTATSTRKAISTPTTVKSVS